VIKAMQAALITYSAIHILLGLALILMPEPTAALMGFGEINATITYLAALCGVMSIAVSVFWIAVARDPLRNTIGIRFAILWVILAAIVQLYLLIRGLLTLSKPGLDLFSIVPLPRCSLPSTHIMPQVQTGLRGHSP